MFNKKTSRLLFLALIILAALYWWNENRSARAQTRTFRDVVLELDVDNVDAFSITNPSDSAGVVKFLKDGEDWIIKQGEYTFNADPFTVNSFLQKFNYVETDRYVGDRESARMRYGLDDKRAVTSSFKVDGNIALSVRVGTLSFSKNNQGAQVDKITYMSVNGEDAIYAGRTDLGNEILSEFNMWRPRYLWNGSNDSWEKIVIVEGDASMTLTKSGDVWMMSSDTVIAERMSDYAMAIADGRIGQFDNSARIEGLEPIKQVIIYDALRDGPRSIKIYQLQDGRYVMVSDENPQSIFQFDMSRGYRKLFRPPSYFVPMEKLKDNPELLQNVKR